MKYLVLNLNGVLDLYLANSLAQTLRNKIPSSNGVVLLNFANLSKIDTNTIQPLFEIFQSLPPTLTFGLCGLAENIKQTILPLFPSDSPLFHELEAGKKYFESIASSESKKGNSYIKLTEYFRKGENFYVYCPNCKEKLRIRSIGNHACPACSIRFYFKPNLSTETEEENTKYEMVPLED